MMKITNVETKEKSTIELTIHVPAEDFEQAVQRAYIKNRKRINIPGFRVGKAPRKIIEGMYGTGVFYDDAVNDCYPQAYEQALAEQNLDSVGYPKIDITEVSKENGITFTALVPVKPEVKLGKYKGLSAPMDLEEVTEKDIDEEMKPLIARASRLVSVTRKAKKDDTVVIDFEGFKDGVPFEGGKGEAYSLKIGSGSFVPGFEEQLIGVKAGEEKELDITFPDDYVADLAGAAVVFKVKVIEVKQSQTPELDDEFAKDVSEFETLADLRKDLGEKLAQRRKVNAEQAHEDAIMNQLVDNMECEIPDGMVEMRMDRIMDDYANRLSSQGLSLETYLQMTGMDTNSMRASTRPAAHKQIQLELAYEAVAQAEKIEVTEQDVEEEIKNLAQQYSMEVEQIKAILPIDDLKRDIRNKKASDLVKAEAKVGKAPAKKKDASEEKAEKKPAAKKTAEKKPAEKKTTEKKTAEKKEAAEDAPAKKPAAKKATEKKPAEKKPAEKKPAAKKKAAEKAE